MIRVSHGRDVRAVRSKATGSAIAFVSRRIAVFYYMLLFFIHYCYFWLSVLIFYSPLLLFIHHCYLFIIQHTKTDTMFYFVNFLEYNKKGVFFFIARYYFYCIGHGVKTYSPHIRLHICPLSLSGPYPAPSAWVASAVAVVMASAAASAAASASICIQRPWFALMHTIFSSSSSENAEKLSPTAAARWSIAMACLKNRTRCNYT